MKQVSARAPTDGLPIALDDECSWPSEVLALLQSVEITHGNRNLLTAQIDALVADRNIVGYQCTRLHLDEIALIESGSLRPLTAALIRERVRRLVVMGKLRPDLGERLIKESRLEKEPSRGGLLGFILTKEVPESYWHFFRYWGGEAVYSAHMYDDGELKLFLKSTGLPCIIELSVPIGHLSHHTAASGIVFSYCTRREIDVPEAGTYDYVRVPAEVLRVIRYGTEEFLNSVGPVSWPNPIHP